MMDENIPEQLDEYLDGALDDAGRAALESRLATDAHLRDKLDAMRRLRAQVTALPRAIEPHRDLWPEIASRLEAPRRDTVDFSRYRRRRQVPIARYLAAAAALVLFALGAPVWFNPPRPGVEPPEPVADSPLAAEPEFQRVTAQYLAARDELMALLEERKTEIAPETYAVVEENLALIASAVSDIELALAAEPESEKLERMLYAAYRSEVKLLQQAIQLSDGEPASNNTEATRGDSDDV